jgi:hypothetical protein
LITVPKCHFEIQTVDCNWAHERDVGSNADWIYEHTGSDELMTGPLVDHTYRQNGKGTYLVLKSSATDFGKRARIITPWVKSINDRFCALRFYYYMFGKPAEMGSLTVYARFSNQSTDTLNLFSTSGNSGQQWLRSITPVSDLRPFQFVIEGHVGKGNEGDVAIDDVSFSEGCVRTNPIPVQTLPTTKGPVVIPTSVQTKPPLITNPTIPPIHTIPTNPTIPTINTNPNPSSAKPTVKPTIKTTNTKISQTTKKVFPTVNPKQTTSLHSKSTPKSIKDVKGNTDSKKAGPDSMYFIKILLNEFTKVCYVLVFDFHFDANNVKSIDYINTLYIL